MFEIVKAYKSYIFRRYVTTYLNLGVENVNLLHKIKCILDTGHLNNDAVAIAINSIIAKKNSANQQVKYLESLIFIIIEAKKIALRNFDKLIDIFPEFHQHAVKTILYRLDLMNITLQDAKAISRIDNAEIHFKLILSKYGYQLESNLKIMDLDGAFEIIESNKLQNLLPKWAKDAYYFIYLKNKSEREERERRWAERRAKMKDFTSPDLFLSTSSGSGNNRGGQGWVYILYNPSMPGLLKIGCTTRDLEIRIKELSSSTGVPTPFQLLHKRQFIDCKRAEKTLHGQLENYRKSNSREFFKIDHKTAIQLLEHIQ